MLQLTLNSQEYLFVPVPEDSRCIYVDDSGDRLLWCNKDYEQDFTTLPSGSWSIIGTTAEVLESEELAKEIVEFKNISSSCACEYCGYDVDCYRNYVEQSDFDWTNYPVADRAKSALDSFRSLLKHNNIPHSIILQKQ